MGIYALGLNHTTAPLDVRGKFAFTLDELPPALQGLQAQLSMPLQPKPDAAAEVALLSTCNRTELYFSAANEESVAPAIDWLAQTGRVLPSELKRHTYVREHADAARHAFRVASGLDSMVLGETQILGQLKDAVRTADEAGALGTTLHQLFQRSFSVAKEVRSNTEIGAHSVSMAAASVRLASQLFEDLSSTRVLFVGAGEMIELVATHFAARKPRQMAITNRTIERGMALAEEVGATTFPLADLPNRLHEFDVVVSCTASTLPIIGLGAVERAVKARRRKPMFMVDLAVPRDIEPEVAHLEDVYLYTVDDLASAVQTAGDKRLAAVAQAEGIIETGVQSFVQWLERRETVPLIQALNTQADAWAQAELERARRLLARGEDVNKVLEALSKGLTQKMLHGPLAELAAAEGTRRAEASSVLQRVFLRH
jgi:glutamyl-tRNA reductase